MSTAGKVLTGFVIVVALFWVLLAASVTQYNRNGTQALEALKKQVTQLQQDITKAKRDLQQLTDRAFQERMKAQKDLTVLQARQAEVEKARSQVLEVASRVNYQLEGVTATVKAG